jgi:NAD(P)-dependent dehydrogenase (short-subunit alcohol dehydrogenase family)
MAGLCEGRVAIVTGGGRGIGREYCLMLAAEGAKVVVNDLGGAPDGSGSDLSPAEEVVAEIAKTGGEAVANGADVSNFEQAGAMIDQAVKTFGRFDVLISNAGILRDRMLVNMTEAEWDAVIKVHLKGTFGPTRHAAAYWRELVKGGQQVDARIVNTSSTSGLFGNPGQTNYGTAKSGIAGFTVILAQELARYGVTVNAIAPAALTRMTEDLNPDRPVPKAGEFDRFHAANIAPLVVWLASPEARDVTGRVFLVAGGTISVAEGWRRGPTVKQDERWDAAALGSVIPGLVAEAAPNSTMRS